MERLIKLIDEGDSEVILAEDSLVPKFNELLKYDLVVIKDDRVFLTEKGKLAKDHGIGYIIEQDKLPKKNPKKSLALRINGKIYSSTRFSSRTGSIYLLSLILLITLAYFYFIAPFGE